MSHPRLPESLAAGVQVIGRAMGAAFKYYSFQVTDPSQRLTIMSVLCSAQPYSQDSHPDIYVSNRSSLVTQENYMWKATNSGGNKVEILPSDPLYTAGVYYIGILAYTPNMNVFTVQVDLSAVGPVVLLQDEHTDTVDTWTYYQVPIQHPEHSRLEVTVHPGLGVLALFVSPTHYYPSQQEHVWSVVSAT